MALPARVHKLYQRLRDQGYSISEASRISQRLTHISIYLPAPKKGEGCKNCGKNPCECQSIAKYEMHRYSSTQINIDEPLRSKILSLAAAIPDSDLAADGRESEPHVTVRWGLHADSPIPVSEILETQKPIRYRLGAVSLFESSDDDSQRGGDAFDVVKVDIISEDLHRINKRLASLPHTDTHPTYHPHATLAYVKAGLGKKYAGMSDLSGEPEAISHSVEFSSKNGDKTTIPLRSLDVATMKANIENLNPDENPPGKVGGKTIRLVDADEVKLEHDMEFNDGGHGYRFPFIPAGEVWIDTHQPDERIAYVILRHCIECNMMDEGASETTARQIALGHEKAYRIQDAIDALAAQTPCSTCGETGCEHARALVTKYAMAKYAKKKEGGTTHLSFDHDDPHGHWVTMPNGTKVYIDHGEVEKGPPGMVGKSPDEAFSDKPKDDKHDEPFALSGPQTQKTMLSTGGLPGQQDLFNTEGIQPEQTTPEEKKDILDTFSKLDPRKFNYVELKELVKEGHSEEEIRQAVKDGLLGFNVGEGGRFDDPDRVSFTNGKEIGDATYEAYNSVSRNKDKEGAFRTRQPEQPALVAPATPASAIKEQKKAQAEEKETAYKAKKERANSRRKETIESKNLSEDQAKQRAGEIAIAKGLATSDDFEPHAEIKEHAEQIVAGEIDHAMEYNEALADIKKRLALKGNKLHRIEDKGGDATEAVDDVYAESLANEYPVLGLAKGQQPDDLRAALSEIIKAKPMKVPTWKDAIDGIAASIPDFEPTPFDVPEPKVEEKPKTDTGRKELTDQERDERLYGKTTPKSDKPKPDTALEVNDAHKNATAEYEKQNAASPKAVEKATEKAKPQDNEENDAIVDLLGKHPELIGQPKKLQQIVDSMREKKKAPQPSGGEPHRKSSAEEWEHAWEAAHAAKGKSNVESAKQRAELAKETHAAKTETSTKAKKELIEARTKAREHLMRLRDAMKQYPTHRKLGKTIGEFLKEFTEPIKDIAESDSKRPIGRKTHPSTKP